MLKHLHLLHQRQVVVVRCHLRGEGKESNNKSPGRRRKGKGKRRGGGGGKKGRSSCVVNVITFLAGEKRLLLFLLTKGSDSNSFELK